VDFASGTKTGFYGPLNPGVNPRCVLTGEVDPSLWGDDRATFRVQTSALRDSVY